MRTRANGTSSSPGSGWYAEDKPGGSWSIVILCVARDMRDIVIDYCSVKRL